MKRLRVPLIHDGRSFTVALPTFQVLPNSFRPVTAALLGPDGPLPGAVIADVLALNPTVGVDIPDEDFPAGGATDAEWRQHLDRRYRERAGQYDPKQR